LCIREFLRKMDFWACWLLSIIRCKFNALLVFMEHHLIPAIHVLRGSLYFGFGCRTCELSISIICMQFFNLFVDLRVFTHSLILFVSSGSLSQARISPTEAFALVQVFADDFHFN
jgi:hypothetical protein